MLRTKIFRGFALIVLMFAALSALFGFGTIKRRMMDELQNKVRLDLSSAWSVLSGQIENMETIMSLVSGTKEVQETGARLDWDNVELRMRLETVRRRFNLDFLGMAATDGTVVFRSTPPFNTGDNKMHSPAIARALAGEQASGVSVWSQHALALEADGLAERAFLELEDTPHSRLTPKTSEDRGMVIIAAAPVHNNAGVSAVVYGGVLLNRNHEFVDKIRRIIYGDGTYRGVPLGTATVFLDDSRIATTVLRKNGNRALGTRVSKEVASRVLDNERPWIGEAFVVNSWYLTAYDPIVDIDGKIVGMLYVGILRQPFADYGRRLMVQYAALCIFALSVSLVVAFLLANRLSRPIHRLVEAASLMSRGETPVKVPVDGACSETSTLVSVFNTMSEQLVQREKSLKATNRSYMETLGFVSHELKSPVSSIVNYLYLMRQHKLGPLTEKQERAMLICERGVNRLVEMIRHYLNLSRIENRELSPSRSRVEVCEEIISPLLDSMESDIQEKNVDVRNNVGEDIRICADINMAREVFDNLIGNAVKYGPMNGTVTLDAAPADGMVQFSVHNEGPGIPPEKQTQLFQKFYRADKENRHTRGTGLGLFISRHIAEAHGGCVHLESSDEKGTTVFFTLPEWSDSSSSDTMGGEGKT